MDKVLTLSELSEGVGGQCPPEPPVWQRLRDSTVTYSNRLAVASLHQPATLYSISTTSASNGCLRWSYAELGIALERLTAGLERLGVKRREAIVTFLPNGIEFVLAFWVAHRLGCPFVPLNHRTLMNAAEAAHMLRVVGPSNIIVQDSQVAARFDELFQDESSVQTKIVVFGSQLRASWTTFQSLIQTVAAGPSINGTQGDNPDDTIITVLFTSGTTSLPKGVPHTNRSLNAFCQNLSLGGRTETSIFCSVLPNNHAMGYFYTLHFMMNGAAVVYPSPSFDANAMVKCLESEKVTHTALVPTTLYALLETLKTRGAPLNSSLVDVCLAGSSVTPDNMRQAVYELRSDGVSTGFGMTEGSPIWTSPRKDPEELIAGDLTIVGSASPGALVRICEPESRTVVPRGERGEVHQAGPGLVKAYLGAADGEGQFYTDEEDRLWFATGDQGLMHSDGRVSITGRYKDMIIRGGENIAPAAIEAIVNNFSGLQVQVVGAPDVIAGEVPVVIVRDLTHKSAREFQKAVLAHMGAAFVPDEVITLAQLGLTGFPTTVSGKVQKSRLVELVRSFRNHRDSCHPVSATEGSMKDILLRAYYKSCGNPIENIDVEAPVSDFADSVSFMRVRSFLRKELGYTMTVQDMVDNPTIASQVSLLQKQSLRENGIAHGELKPSGPPSLHEMSIMFGGFGQAEKMRNIISDTLQIQGFSWTSDVASIVPVHDFMKVFLKCGLSPSCNFAIAVTTMEPSVQKLRAALVKVLTGIPIWPSFYVLDQTGDPHYVTLKPSGKLWDLCILDQGTVKTSEDVQKIAVQYPYQEHARAPGPLFRALLVHIEETGLAAMVTYINHLVQDASLVRIFYEDLEQALSYPLKEIRPHVSFNAWADSYQALRYSPIATASVDYHVKRLGQLHLHRKALYPPAHLPRKAITESPDGFDHIFDAPGLLHLKKAHPNIIAAVVLKAALAVVDVSRTNHTHALYCNFEAGRMKFPFIPPSVEALHSESYEAADVAGPLMETVCNLIEVPHSETGLSLLQRLQAEQLELTKHSHAPLLRVIDGLNSKHPGAGGMVLEALHTHFMSWVPGLLGDYERLRVAQLAIRCTGGLVVVAALVGPTASTYFLTLRWDVANYSREESRAYALDLERAVLWLTEEGNWRRPIGDFLKGLGEKEGAEAGNQGAANQPGC